MRKLNPVSFAVSICLAANGLPAIAKESNEEQQKIIITGSHIKRIENESSSPLVVLEQEDIARSGATTLAGLLETTVLNSGGALNNQQTSGFTPGAASYNLRGLRSDRTLVLVDGRRLASYPFGQNGSVAFFDLNMIPLAEIESVEILKDGASAVYGSDAISGVVNVITKRSFNGSEVKFKTLQTETDYQGNSLSYLGGFSDSNNDLVVVAEIQDYDALRGQDFQGAATLNASEANVFSFPGSYLTQQPSGDLLFTPAPNCARSESAATYFENVAGDVCVNDWAADRQLLPENQRSAISAKWTHFLGEYSLYTGLSISKIETVSDVPFGQLGNSFFYNATETFNPLDEAMVFYRGFSEIGLQTIETEANNTNFVIGLEGLLGEYDFDINLSHSLTKVDELYADGWVHQDDAAAFYTAIENREINPFDVLSAEQISALTSQFAHNGKSYQTAISAKLSGEIAELEHGPIYFASGLELRQEFIRDTSDQAILDSEVVGLGSSSAEGDRDISAVFGEFIIPAGENLEFNAALRIDNYSDFGSSVNPKLSMSYKPTESVLLRASYGTGFRAPNLFELYTDEVSGSVGNFPFIQVANPDLEAETSESFNIGLVFDINEQFMASFDLWQIEVEDMITNLGVNTILTATDENDELIYSDLIITNPDDSIAYIIDPFLNLDSQKSQGIDITARLAFTDVLELKLNASHIAKLEQVNTAIGQSRDLEGTYLFPENRISANLIWQTNDFTHTLSAYYFDEHGSEDFMIDSYSRFDYQVSFAMDSHLFNVMIGNLADDLAPTNRLGPWPYYEQRMYSPIGRNVSLTWTYQY